MVALPLNPLLSYGSSVAEETRMIDDEAVFGEGYGQREVDGINADVQTGTLTWKKILDTEAETLRLFFKNLGSDHFTYQPNGQPAPLKWKRVGKFSVTPTGFKVSDCKQNIKQVFDLD